MIGRVKFYDQNRWFGFGVGEDARDYFLSKAALERSNFDRLAGGQAVEFELREYRGRQEVRTLTLIEDDDPAEFEGLQATLARGH